MGEQHNIIIDLRKLVEEQKDIIEQQNKLLLDSITEKNKMHEEIVLIRRNCFYLEHENRVLKDKVAVHST